MHYHITRKLALTVAIAAAFAGTSLGTASAATLAHHAGYVVAAAREPVDAPLQASSASPAEELVAVPTQPSTRNCIRGHLSHRHC